MTNHRVWTPAALLVLVLWVAACGGGGGGGGNTGGSGGGGGGSSGGGGPVNAPPVMAAASFSGNEEADISGQISATDSNNDTLTFAVDMPPARGTLVSFTASGAFTYRPDTDVFGTDTFTVSVSDGHGGTSSAVMTVNIANVNDAPVASHDRVEVASATSVTVDVLDNDVDVDADTDELTVSVIEPALVGTAGVNADNTVTISGLPAGFRGLTRFGYRVTDTGGQTSDAIANVFVDTRPFRVVLRVPAPGGAGSRIAISDFTGEPRILNPDEPADRETGSFRPALEGDAVAYHRTQTGTLVGELCVVRTGGEAPSGCYVIPNGLELQRRPPLDLNFLYEISPDGRWVAAVLVRIDDTVGASLHLIDTSDPTSARVIEVPGAPHAVTPAFTADSSALFFIGHDALVDNNGLGVYRLTLSGAAEPIRMTAPEDPASRIDNFAVSADGSRLVFERVSGDTGLWYVETATPGVEHRLSHVLAVDESLVPRSGQGLAVNPAMNTVSYTVRQADMSAGIWMADVSATTPAPRLVATVPSVFAGVVSPMVRPDGGAVTYAWWTSFSQDATVYEATKTPAAPVTVASGLFGGYELDGDNFIIQRYAVTPNLESLFEFCTLTRDELGFPSTKLGTPGTESRLFSNLLYESHGAVVLSESEIGDAGSMIRPVLVNLDAPDKPLPLTSDTFPTIDEDGINFHIVD